jgi:hypothetical protein
MHKLRKSNSKSIKPFQKPQDIVAEFKKSATIETNLEHHYLLLSTGM